MLFNSFNIDGKVNTSTFTHNIPETPSPQFSGLIPTLSAHHTTSYSSPYLPANWSGQQKTFGITLTFFMCHFMEFVSPKKKSAFLLILFKNNIGQFGLISIKSSLLSTDYLTNDHFLIGLYSVMERCFSARSWSPWPFTGSLEWLSSLSTVTHCPFLSWSFCFLILSIVLILSYLRHYKLKSVQSLWLTWLHTPRTQFISSKAPVTN